MLAVQMHIPALIMAVVVVVVPEQLAMLVKLI
jgi:hypothetical protein